MREDLVDSEFESIRIAYKERLNVAQEFGWTTQLHLFSVRVD